MSTLKALADFLSAFGAFGVAALAIGWGLMERAERQKTQAKYDKLAEILPGELLGIVRETNKTIANWTSAANAVLERRRT